MWVIINNERVNLDKVVNYHQGFADKETLYIKYIGVNGWDIFEFKNKESCEEFIHKIDKLIDELVEVQ